MTLCTWNVAGRYSGGRAPASQSRRLLLRTVFGLAVLVAALTSGCSPDDRTPGPRTADPSANSSTHANSDAGTAGTGRTGPDGTTAADDDNLIRLSTGEWPPYFSSDLPHGGSALRVVREAFRLEGFTVEYVFLPWQRAYEAARTGKYDGTAAWGLDAPGRLEEFHASDSIFDTEWVFFHRADRSLEWDTLDDLSELLIGATDKYTYGSDFYDADREGRIRVEWVPSDEMNYRKLLAGRIDAFPQDEVVGYHDLQRMFGGRAKEIVAHQRRLRVTGNHLLIRHDHARGEQLIAAFNRGLARLRDDGRLRDWLYSGRAPDGN